MKTKMERQRETIEVMIRLYCKHFEGNSTLCDECNALLQYANARLDHCPHGAKKGSCRKCAVHCYRPDMREKIRQVMRYAGPRMSYRHPVMAIRHICSELFG